MATTSDIENGARVLRGGGGAELLGDWVQDVPAFRLAWWPPVSSD